MKFLKRTWACIDLDQIRHNYHVIRSNVRPGCRILSIVKADAYGHGAVDVAACLQKEGTDWFGVSNLEEAIQLRRAGIDRPILILSYTPPEEAARLAQLDITQAVVGLSYARQLNDEAAKAGVTVQVHVKIDTGMSRVGLMAQNSEERLQAQRQTEEICTAMPHLRATGIFTHFATADEENDTFTRQQYASFMQIIEALRQKGITFEIRHCCNSAATLLFPDMQLDMVRPGLILYGLFPAEFMQKSGRWDLRPAMELKTAVSLVKPVPAGATFGYGRTCTAGEEMRVATVSIGYADGLPRCISNKACMLLNGKPAPIVGRVSMDQCMLDVTHVGPVQAGAVATVFGKDGDACLPVEQLAALAGTIPYETVCLIGKRVPRIYTENGQPVAARNYITPENP